MMMMTGQPVQHILWVTPVVQVVSAALSERKVAGSIPTTGDFHTVGPWKKTVFACLATDLYLYTFTPLVFPDLGFG